MNELSNLPNFLRGLLRLQIKQGSMWHKVRKRAIKCLPSQFGERP